MLVRPDDGGINHNVLEIWILPQDLEKYGPKHESGGISLGWSHRAWPRKILVGRCYEPTGLERRTPAAIRSTSGSACL